LIARHPSETEVLMEDLWKTPLSTLRKIHFNSKETILTQVLKEHANTTVQRGLVIFLHSMKLNQTKVNSKLLSTSLLFQSI
jgi:hypothetical protein